MGGSRKIASNQKILLAEISEIVLPVKNVIAPMHLTAITVITHHTQVNFEIYSNVDYLKFIKFQYTAHLLTNALVRTSHLLNSAPQ